MIHSLFPTQISMIRKQINDYGSYSWILWKWTSDPTWSSTICHTRGHWNKCLINGPNGGCLCWCIVVIIRGQWMTYWNFQYNTQCKLGWKSDFIGGEFGSVMDKKLKQIHHTPHKIKENSQKLFLVVIWSLTINLTKSVLIPPILLTSRRESSFSVKLHKLWEDQSAGTACDKPDTGTDGNSVLLL